MNILKPAILGLLIAARFGVCAQPAVQPSGTIVQIAGGLSIRNHQKRHYYAMETWDEGQYDEYALWEETELGSIVTFMNFRVAFPEGYDPSDASTKYPVILMLHGAGESGRKWDGNFQYEPSDPEYDNNGHQLRFVGRTHYEAQHRSETHDRHFHGFVILPQASYNAGWGHPEVDRVIRFLEWMIREHHIDQDRIAIHGLSNGAKGAWRTASTRPDLFSTLLTMSGVGTEPDRMIDSLVTTPVWIFQGGEDTNPSPAYSRSYYDKFLAKGGIARYTLYEEEDHEIWNQAYGEPDFFAWIRGQHKKHISILGGENAADPLRLAFSAGFQEYQWLRNGHPISRGTTRFITAHLPGSYTVRFRRVTDGTWDESFALEVTYPDYVPLDADPLREVVVYPNPFSEQLTIQNAGFGTTIRLIDTSGKTLLSETISNETTVLDLHALRPGMYVLIVGAERHRVIRR